MKESTKIVAYATLTFFVAMLGLGFVVSEMLAPFEDCAGLKDAVDMVWIGEPCEAPE